ncbi:response regulator [Daejeonella sp.]|uniref:response regulator n=1 Tax=Daejeonella sp. TaxID=2805397 RepID=UPI0030C250AB
MAFEKLNSVLCVNDNDITLFILKRTISNANFAEKIIEKKDGSQALTYCQQLIDTNEYQDGNYPKVIFLDLHMPVMDGWEFLDQFSTHIWPYFKETKIVITSQSIDTSESVRASQHPFVIDFHNEAMTTQYLITLQETLERANIQDANQDLQETNAA